MEVSAKLSNAGLSPQKARLVANAIRGKAVDSAVETLSYTNKKAAAIIKKLLLSAVANAEHNEGADIDDLNIKSICVDEAPTLKRYKARAKGRGTRILKRRCHIKIVVSDIKKS